MERSTPISITETAINLQALLVLKFQQAAAFMAAANRLRLERDLPTSNIFQKNHGSVYPQKRCCFLGVLPVSSIVQPQAIDMVMIPQLNQVCVTWQRIFHFGCTYCDCLINWQPIGELLIDKSKGSNNKMNLILSIMWIHTSESWLIFINVSDRSMHFYHKWVVCKNVHINNPLWLVFVLKSCR